MHRCRTSPPDPRPTLVTRGPVTHKGSPVRPAVHKATTPRSLRAISRHCEAMDTTEVGYAFRSARKRLRMSQRAYAKHLGISPARMARFEVDAGRQPLELVIQVLAQSGFQLLLRPVADKSDPAHSDDHEQRSTLDLFDAAGRRLPAHCDPYRLSSPQMWWYVRTVWWGTRPAPPVWSYRCPARSNPRWGRA